MRISILHRRVLRAMAGFLLFLAFGTPAAAQTTGKIAGRVVDAAGEPLPGVNVYIEGTTQGNSTDADGEYFILNVRPGSYTLVASFIGFSTVRITDVAVQVDRTTRVDVTLAEETIEGEEVVVVAERSLITLDQTSASAKVSGDELLKLPAQNFVQTVSAQAGVSQGQSGSLHIRGGRTSEIKYYVDGIAVSNPFSNALAVPVENTAVQEVEVISGTYNAEYGQANSGIVNIVTRDGGNDFKGTFIGSVGTYRTGDEDVFYELGSSSWTGEQSYEASLSGPVLRDRLTFFTSVKTTSSEGWLKGREVFLPADSSNFSSNDWRNWMIESSGDSSIVPRNTRSGTTLMGKLTWRSTGGVKITYSATSSGAEAKPYGHAFKLLPGYLPTQHSRSFNQLLSLNHALSARTFYNVRLTSYTTRFEQYVYEDPLDPRYSILEGRAGQRGQRIPHAAA